MNNSAKGCLLVMMQVAPTLEEEFNDWYDTEHVPERLAVPGFESAVRYRCTSGAPRYLAIYDLESLGVLDSREYRAVSGANFSPWTRRITSRVDVYRAAGTQIYPGDAITRRAARLLVLRFRELEAAAGAAIVKGMRRTFGDLAQTRQVKVVANETDKGVDFIGLVEARGLLDNRFDVEAFSDHADTLDLIATYAPYGLGPNKP